VWLADRLRYEAAGCGFRLAEAHDVHGPTSTATVIAGECLGSRDATQAAGLRRLAAAAGVDILAAHFNASGRFVTASLRPDLGSASVVRALVQLVGGRRA
jgi:hypothetical protein